MKAIVFKSPGEYSYDEVPYPELPKGGVIVKVISAGLCGSDVRTFASGHAKVTPPFIIGHELAGIIVESDNPNFKEGDKVLANPGVTCGECDLCQDGMSNLCQDMIVIGTTIPGGYAQYLGLPERAAKTEYLHKLPDDADLDLYPIIETLASVYSTQDNIGLGEGDVVVIEGAGPLGNLHAENAKARGASKVIMSEPSQSRLDMARRFKSIDVFVNPLQEDLKEVVMKETNGKGADVVITACPVGEVQAEAIFLVRPRGTVLLFGGLPPDKRMVTFDANYIHYKEINVVGGYSYPPEFFKKSLDIVTSGQIDAEKFVTHRFPLKDLQKGIDAIKNGDAIKVILKPFEE